MNLHFSIDVPLLSNCVFTLTNSISRKIQLIEFISNIHFSYNFFILNVQQMVTTLVNHACKNKYLKINTLPEVLLNTEKNNENSN